MNAEQILTFILDEMICCASDDAAEIIKRLEAAGFKIVPKDATD
jgi:hypothetical protein